MANTKNLRKGNPETQFKAGREQVETARKGGKASGQAKRKRKEFKEALKLALSVVMEDDKSVQDKGIEALMQKFMSGDVKAFEVIRDTIGEKPTDKQEVKVIDSEWFK